MMKKAVRCFLLIILCITLASLTVSALPQPTTETPGKGILIAGNPDFYPVEYFNQETNRFEGVLPSLLRDISAKTGIPLTYSNDTSYSQTELAESGQATILSGYIIRGKNTAVQDTATVFTYNQNGEDVKIGLAFTKKADKAVTERLKKEIHALSSHDLNSYFIQNKPYTDRNARFVSIFFALLFLIVVAFTLSFGINLRKIKQKIQNSKLIDENTGIGNLTYFETQFVTMISKYLRTSYYVSYIILDNDFLQLHYGKTVFGDVIEHAAYILTSSARESEFVARITESGFAFSFRADGDAEAETRISTLSAQLNELILPNASDSTPLFYISVYNLQQDDYNSETVLFNLRRNCNRIVGTPTQYVFCSEQDMNSAIEERKLAETYMSAMKNKEFKLYLQFSVDNKTKRISSAEALSRWQHPEKGLLFPGMYLDSLEAVGLIQDFDYYMFDKVCQQLHKWKDTEFDHISISCNFTRITLSEKKFLYTIKEIANKYVFNHDKLIVEITENAMEKDRKNVLANVLGCKNLGFSIALDDLGSGYTSLSNLCDYPVDIVKIDRDILLKTTEKSGRDLFEGLVSLMHGLNKEIVCEGVETTEQNDFVSASACDYIQGWYYFKATPVKECEHAFRQYSFECSS